MGTLISLEGCDAQLELQINLKQIIGIKPMPTGKDTRTHTLNEVYGYMSLNAF